MSLAGGLAHLKRNAIAYVALFVALSSGAYAAGLARNSVKSKHIAAQNVRTADIAPGAVNRAQLAPNAVDSSKVAPDSLGFPDIDEASLDGSQIQGVTVDESTLDGSQIEGVNAASVGGRTPAQLQGTVRFAYVMSAGNVNMSRGLDSASRTAAGQYRLDFNGAVTGCAILSSLGSGSGAGTVYAGTGGVGDPADIVLVTTRTTTWAAQDNHFYVAVIC